MLKINDKIIDVYTTEIKYSNSQYNSDFGYSPVITIEYEQENKRGYISFFLDFHEELNFNMLTNKEYIDNPSDINSKISMLEIYDTKDFIDYVDSSVLVSFKDIIDNNIETKINIDDGAIKVEFDGLLYIKR